MPFYVRGVPFEVGSEQKYTGLKDSKGTEIYEGDIVKWSKFNVEAKGSIVWQSYRWGIEGFDPPFDTKVEVIGNIYENPELVK